MAAVPIVTDLGLFASYSVDCFAVDRVMDHVIDPESGQAVDVVVLVGEHLVHFSVLSLVRLLAGYSLDLLHQS